MKHLTWLAILLFTITACQKVDLEKVNDQTRRAKTYLANENLDTAQWIIDSALLLAPKNTEALLVKGKILSLKGNHQEAVKIFDALISQTPKTAGPYLERSIANTNIGNIDQAFKDVEKGLKILPESGPLLMHKGLLHQRKNEHTQAIAIFNDLYEKDTLNGRLVFLRALSKKWSKDIDGAIADINKCLTMDMPNLYEVYEQRAFLYRDKGWDNDAYGDMGMMVNLANAAKSKSMICASRNSRAELLLENKYYKQALEDLNVAIPADESNPYGLVLRARVYLEQEEPEKEKACQDLDLAIERNYTKLYGPAALNLQNLHCKS